MTGIKIALGYGFLKDKFEVSNVMRDDSVVLMPLWVEEYSVQMAVALIGAYDLMKDGTTGC
jgi:hypothetical protein